MNGAQVHLLLNHFPLFGTIFGLIILILGKIWKNNLVGRLGLAFLIISTLAAFPTMGSGEDAEEIVEEMAGVSHDVIHEHEEMAESFIWMMGAMGILSLAAFFGNWKDKKWAQLASWIVIGAAAICIGFGARVNHSGGLIRHPEIEAEPSPSHEKDEHSH